MSSRPLSQRIIATGLTVFIIFATAPMSVAGTLGVEPLAAVVSSGIIRVDNAKASTGTTIFAGDRISAQDSPALVSFPSGSRIEMTKAAAIFTREGDTLVVRANEGLLRFNFKKGEQVQIAAAQYQFRAIGNDAAHVGELGLNKNGELAMVLAQGVFAASNSVTGERIQVNPGQPLILMNAEAKSTTTQASKASKSAAKAGSTTQTSAAAAGAGPAGAGGGISAATAAAIVAGVAGAVGLGVGIHEAIKSTSAR